MPRKTRLPSFEKVFGFRTSLSGDIEVFEDFSEDSREIQPSPHGKEDNGGDENLEQMMTKCISYGRWSEEEHAKFLECLGKYGSNWEKIAEEIPTRTKIQVRTHADKCLHLPEFKDIRKNHSRRSYNSDENENESESEK